LLALVFPIGIDVFISAGQYIVDRAQRAANDFGKFAPPQFRSYFHVPDIWLLGRAMMPFVLTIAPPSQRVRW
jgi:hypothetical protein